MLTFWAFWWTFDDHLARAIDAPGLGELPFWVPFLISMAMGFGTMIYEKD